MTLTVAQGYINTATADYQTAVAESDEDNNTTTDSYTVTEAPPDYYIVSFNAPSSANAGQAIGSLLSATAGNQGGDDPGVTPSIVYVGFYISTDAVITTSDTLLVGGRESISRLNAG
jgi:subtilase family serine protease